ncbi:MAG: nqo3, partial [Rickettsiaceae bacterium]|nr:nqo3 [Rickettsiaceae bacterium]
MPKLTVNGKEIEFEKGMTVLQACEIAGEEIPRFCYHERLKIAGNCRMCLVQIEGGPPKPAASCAMPAGEGMKVHTNTPMVKKAREGVMEFLLMNHPLDCPICDQGGECDLQDQAMAYGVGKSRYHEEKRAVKDKYMGPLVETHMTRCIHCTRCVRFLEDVSGITELGAVNRGEHMEITTYVEKSLTSELSGNIIDLCPVGALTSKPYAFKARPWELRKVETIDVMDAVGSNIRVDARGREVMRILPRLNEDVNEEWISDKTRFCYDGLKLQRLDKPYVRINGKLTPVSWHEAYKEVAAKLKDAEPSSIAAIAGDQADCESMFALKNLMEKLGSRNIDCRQDGAKTGTDTRASYLFNTSIAGIEKADLCLIVGTNPRWDAPIINARIRKASLNNSLKISYIGEESNDFTYPIQHLGTDVKALEAVLNGKSDFSTRLKDANNPMIIIGSSVLARQDGEHILYVAQQIADKYGFIKEDWNGFNVLQNVASRVGGL